MTIYGRKECMFCGVDLGPVPGLEAGTVTTAMCHSNNCVDEYNNLYGEFTFLPYKQLDAIPYGTPLMDKLRTENLLKWITG